ncbi:MAG: N-acetylmuramoyl-L-alanine amidase [Lewinella sp.]|nr:N-acetylmuramoyl-L-alanine amidase [Lewinella sp.]
MVTDFLVFLDAGHGGLDAAGHYVTAPSKQFKHSRGTFHGDGWFYEGVWNRVLTNRVAQKLERLGVPYYLVSHEYLDTPLAQRVDVANWYARRVEKTLYISNHANVGGGQARGFEIYTSPGRTRSDVVAEMHWDHVKELFGNDIARYREDTSDGDHDKEERFYVLTRTAMAAILVEHLFFDNFQDASQLMDDDIIDRFAEAQVRTIVRAASVL